jgi:tetratricopeptide (TPR) repeat protein
MLPASSDIRFQQNRLDTWKSIAGHLGRSCRTVQRWHFEYGLPVRHLGGDSGSVFAYADELDDWMRNRGRAVINELPEINEPVPLDAPHGRVESNDRNKMLTSPQIPGSAKARSAALVALAWKMWEALSAGNLNLIAQHFREAIDLDPGNAAAYAGLSNILIVQGFLCRVSASSAYASAQAALQMALEIDSEIPEAKSAAAWLKLVVKRDWQGARRGFDEGLRHRPRTTRDLVGRAMLHIARGCFKESSSLLLEAFQLNPLSTPSTSLYCWSEYLAGEYAHVLDQVDQCQASGRSGFTLDAVGALASIQLEGPDAAIERIETMTANSPHHCVLEGVLGCAYALAGQDRRAGKLLDAMTNPKSLRQNREPYAVALILIGLNRRQEAVQWLEQSYRDGSHWSLGFPFDPILAPLRNDPHYKLFMNRASYPQPEDTDPLWGIAG